MHKLLLGGIVLLAFLLRVIGLENYPTGFTPDEASFGYDAYSLLKTGRDQWGESWPLTLRSFGDFKLPVYAYLTIPSVALFGLSEFAVRLPNALLGTLAVLFTYLWIRAWIGGSKSLGLLAATFLATSPWHISLSRGAFEANLTTFLLPFGLWAFFKAANPPKSLKNHRLKPGFMFLAALAFGLSLFSYHSARLLTIPIMTLFIWQRREVFAPWPRGLLRYKAAVFAFFAFVILVFYSMFSGSAARSSDVAIFNPTGGWGVVADRRYEAVLQGLPDQVARAFSNKAVYVWDQFIGGYFSYLSPQFLFAQGAGEWTYGMIPGRGVLYLIELPLLLFFLFRIKFVKPLVNPLTLILFWVLLAPIPAALAKGPGFAANRAAVMMPAIQIASAFGAMFLYGELTSRIKRKDLRKYIVSGFAAALALSLIFFLEDYRYHAPLHGASSMLYGRGEAVEFAQSVEDRYGEIIFSRSLSEPHIYVAFYNRWNPSDYQRQAQDWLRYEQEGRSFVDQLGEYRLGKYTFRSINRQRDLDLQGVLLVAKPNEFPEDVVALRKVNYPNGEPAILIVDPTQQTYAKSN